MKSFGSSSGSSSSGSNILSSFRTSLTQDPHATTKSFGRSMIAHQGALYQIEAGKEETDVSEKYNAIFAIDIGLEDGESTHTLKFSAQDFDFVQRLFAILDTESRGAVDRNTIKEFVTVRCPVFFRRDDDLRRVQAEATNSTSDKGKRFKSRAQQRPQQESPTFDEVWKSVVEGSKTPEMRLTEEDMPNVEMGVESWMVFCRFIALAQYLEAKRRFSARHLQQTMRHRNSPRGSEVVVVDVPPPEPPAPLSREQLVKYERKSRPPLPLPEFDLDHIGIAAHDVAKRRAASSSSRSQGSVKISLFGSVAPLSSASSPSPSKLEFKISYLKNSEGHCVEAPIVVRRSMEDMKWLNDTFTSHNVLGGTLCGRILPPFPGSSGKVLAAQFQRDDAILASSAIKNTTGGAIAAAAAGVEIIKDVAMSFWKTTASQIPKNSGGGVSSCSPTNPTQITTSRPANKKKASSKLAKSICLALPESYYNPNSPEGKARQVERYLNYLLEHPALSTSFPLNTILQASQSGLEAAKQSLEECLRLSKEMKEQTPQLADGRTIIPFLSSGSQPSLSWVRTAAQAAMALKVHGILETTGMPSASARLQHASLPNFDHSVRRGMDWVDDVEGDDLSSGVGDRKDGDGHSSGEHASSFEQGVVRVRSELKAEAPSPSDNDGYDLLPLPIPAPERRILSAGSRSTNGGISNEGDAASVSSCQGGSIDSREARFHYGTHSLRGHFSLDDEDDTRSAFLGDIAVDEHIDKLREVIGSVDNTLSRCLASSGSIGRARRERLALHLELVQGFDSWTGLRGKFIGQRPLLKGVSGIQQSNEVYDESDLALIDDVSWQTSLANSAVSAAEEVRSAVRAARTAENAKAAASAAAFAAQSACETGSFPTMDEARAAQTRASIAQSHAFHAAVVEHEAKAVKRRATLALANDVKCWNVHRKREMLKACIAHARSQHEATRRAVDAWSCLRDGYIGSTTLDPSQTRMTPVRPAIAAKGLVHSRGPSNFNAEARQEATDRSSSSLDLLDTSSPSEASSATASQHPSNSGAAFSSSEQAVVREISADSADGGFSCIDASECLLSNQLDTDDVTATIYQDLATSSRNDKPVIVAVDHDVLASCPAQAPPTVQAKAEDGAVDKSDSENESLPFAEPLPLVAAAPLEEPMVTVEPDSIESHIRVKQGSGSEENEIMSASMQSLVDGLMTWGGQFETEDILALPTGMAASIALEESDPLNQQGTF